MTLKIKKNIIEQMFDHARRDAPIEACGYLGQSGDVVSVVYKLTNIDASAEHFSFDPKEQFAILKKARAQRFSLCAVYHSHPASPARPSAEDIKLANDPSMIYVIVSLASVKEDVKAFRITGGRVENEEIEVVS